MLEAMMAPLGTLVFLATLWLLVVMGAAALEESGARIGAALKGDAASGSPVQTFQARRRPSPRAQQPMTVGQRWRAAA